jgi:hypothetical protein
MTPPFTEPKQGHSAHRAGFQYVEYISASEENIDHGPRSPSIGSRTIATKASSDTSPSSWLGELAFKIAAYFETSIEETSQYKP